ncbi:trehalose-phosphatase [Cellulomonas marina]|uniref:Trehalose 6-phosphate phosphatase n=1 Tax=Cellulomonas marina TaxID=988821 RepID=A0A1I0WKL9_9CELL|nr:trehalose-phosphatase [Cellulomonas marina]GIG27713.1 trehalose 6-phosphate phosphatase [Cellulomonas marina]SFA89161.1 trehalose 6-phosphate phosphatase [Cellulomonas marina]
MAETGTTTGVTTGTTTGPSTGATADAAAVAALTALAGDADARPLLVALDFDGVLAPLQDDPSASRALPASVAALARLGQVRGVHLALVSGRAMADLQALAEVPVGTVLVGSHGSERARTTSFGLDRAVVRLTDVQQDALADLGAQAAAVARGRDGVWVETKPAAVVVHTRLAPREVAAVAEGEALDLGARLGVHVLHGKDVVEMSVLDADKGKAVLALVRELGARAAVYAGDDVTDENAFRALAGAADEVRGLTVKVGPGSTVAAHRLADPEAVATALTALADALGA